MLPHARTLIHSDSLSIVYKHIAATLNTGAVSEAFGNLWREVGGSVKFSGKPAYFGARYGDPVVIDAAREMARSILLFRLGYGMVPLACVQTGDFRGFRVLIPRLGDGQFAEGAHGSMVWQPSAALDTDTKDVVWSVYVWDALNTLSPTKFVSPVASLLPHMWNLNAIYGNAFDANYDLAHPFTYFPERKAPKIGAGGAPQRPADEVQESNAARLIGIHATLALIRQHARQSLTRNPWDDGYADPTVYWRNGMHEAEARREMLEVELPLSYEAPLVGRAAIGIDPMTAEKAFRQMVMDKFGIVDPERVNTPTASHVNASMRVHAQTIVDYRRDVNMAVGFIERMFLMPLVRLDAMASITNFRSYKRVARFLDAPDELEVHPERDAEFAETELVNKIVKEGEDAPEMVDVGPDGKRRRMPHHLDRDVVTKVVRMAARLVAQNQLRRVAETGTSGTAPPFFPDLPRMPTGRTHLRLAWEFPQLPLGMSMLDLVDRVCAPAMCAEEVTSRISAVRLDLAAAGMVTEDIDDVLDRLFPKPPKVVVDPEMLQNPAKRKKQN